MTKVGGVPTQDSGWIVTPNRGPSLKPRTQSLLLQASRGRSRDGVR